MILDKIRIMIAYKLYYAKKETNNTFYNVCEIVDCHKQDNIQGNCVGFINLLALKFFLCFIITLA